jgi:RNA polymerase sigma factor (sigma-70 family)
MPTNSITLPFDAPEVEVGITFDRGRGVASWSDAQLIFSVQSDPPDGEALNVLVGRYWGSVFARCQMLTLNRERAFDLAQETWCRLLRNRAALKQDGNLPAYLATIATNIFRDSYRAARRAGPLGEHQLVSLESPVVHEEDDAVFLVNVLPDMKTLGAARLAQLKLDIDAALCRLGPLLREVLVARYIDGESCAEIGVRHGRTEQTISGWIRAALRQMKVFMEEPASRPSPGPNSGSDDVVWSDASVPN